MILYNEQKLLPDACAKFKMTWANFARDALKNQVRLRGWPHELGGAYPKPGFDLKKIGTTTLKKMVDTREAKHRSLEGKVHEMADDPDVGEMVEIVPWTEGKSCV